MITPRDKLSHLSYLQARKLLRSEGERLIRTGGKYEIDVSPAGSKFLSALALNADITLASDRVRFVEIFVNISLIPDGGSTYILPKIVIRWASYVNASRWKVGLGMVIGGLALVQLTIMLGG